MEGYLFVNGWTWNKKYVRIKRFELLFYDDEFGAQVDSVNLQLVLGCKLEERESPPSLELNINEDFGKSIEMKGDNLQEVKTWVNCLSVYSNYASEGIVAIPEPLLNAIKICSNEIGIRGRDEFELFNSLMVEEDKVNDVTRNLLKGISTFDSISVYVLAKVWSNLVSSLPSILFSVDLIPLFIRTALTYSENPDPFRFHTLFGRLCNSYYRLLQITVRMFLSICSGDKESVLSLCKQVGHVLCGNYVNSNDRIHHFSSLMNILMKNYNSFFYDAVSPVIVNRSLSPPTMRSQYIVENEPSTQLYGERNSPLSLWSSITPKNRFREQLLVSPNIIVPFSKNVKTINCSNNNSIDLKSPRIFATFPQSFSKITKRRYESEISLLPISPNSSLEDNFSIKSDSSTMSLCNYNNDKLDRSLENNKFRYKTFSRNISTTLSNVFFDEDS